MFAAVKRWLTFANVVAMIALFVALGGTVYAAGKINGKAIKPNSLPGNRLKNNSVTGKKVNSSTLGKVPSAKTADSAQPVAFAEISDTGTVNGAISKGVTNANVTHPSPGTFCISGLSFPIKGGQVTPVFFGTYGTTANFSTGSTGFCPNGGQVLISNAGPASPVPIDTPFDVVLYG